MGPSLHGGRLPRARQLQLLRAPAHLHGHVRSTLGRGQHHDRAAHWQRAGASRGCKACGTVGAGERGGAHCGGPCRHAPPVRPHGVLGWRQERGGAHQGRADSLAKRVGASLQLDARRGLWPEPRTAAAGLLPAPAPDGHRQPGRPEGRGFAFCRGVDAPRQRCAAGPDGRSDGFRERNRRAGCRPRAWSTASGTDGWPDPRARFGAHTK
mmetsp:Transcript_86213/g.257368  ORF Transcript_86213/g.257368 Transcript_86213/m.257368 type:complete len:210 (+) Transcript_86213:1447-2076(+)